MWGYVRLELTRSMRDGGYVIFAIVMPVVMYLVFTNLGLAPGDRREAAIYTMVSMAAYGALGGAFNNGSGIAEDRAAGWLRQLRLTPLTPAQVVAGKVVTGAVAVVPSIAAVLLAGVLVNHVTLPRSGGWRSSRSCGRAPCPSPCSVSATATACRVSRRRWPTSRPC
ncbi:hypothetical protein GCM10027612_47600 [Microbispora bryophytorum subsp. camponoti]